MNERLGNTVLVVDGGGRGAVLVDKYAQSPHVDRLLAVPGNDLMSLNTYKPVQIYPDLKTTSVPQILKICEQEQVDLVDVAQDSAIAVGLVDSLKALGIPVVGPTKAAGQIEWDKAWAREFGKKHGLPQPSFRIYQSARKAISDIRSQTDRPRFIKAAGLAEGKGALSARDNAEAIKHIEEMSRFGKSGKVFLVEDWLRSDDGSPGEEFSTFLITDGRHFQIVGSAQDHKRVFNFDEGENTGGMGCNTPPLVITAELLQKIESSILTRTIAGLYRDGRPYQGVLYLGGMVVNERGQQSPYVIEWNARWGDPEAQVLVLGLINDLYEVSMAVAMGDLGNINIQTDRKSRVVVTGASRGYPGDYKAAKGKQIYGLSEVSRMDGVKIYGAAVKVVDGNKFVNGGRLFYIVGEGKTVIEAREKAYTAMSVVHVDGNNLHFRTDIGWRDVDRLRHTK